jgi:iron complex transport system substrate-binding protein
MALDLDEQLVGVENNADLRPIYGLSNPQILQLPSIGTAKEVDIEACAALMPDLAILPMKVKDSADDLEALGIPVLFVNPESQELLTQMIRLVAAVTDTEETAETLISFLETQENHLTEILSEADRPSVYLAGNSNFLSTAGNAMYQSDMIRLAGGSNVAAEIEDTYWAQIDYEQLLVWDPEYIILPSSAKYTIEDIMTDPNLAGCRAVRNSHVYQVPGDAESWDSPVPGSILGALWLANILHPELMTDTDCAAIMDEYYETFYHFTYSKI